MIHQKIVNFIKKNITIISIAIFIEIFLFNYGFFRTLFIGNINLNHAYEKQDNTIMFKDIDSRITSITFNYKNNLTDKITYDLSYTSEENSYKAKLNQKIILANDKHYINFDTHSKCKTLEIKFYTEAEVEIDSIILNHPNLHIKFIRICAIFILEIFLVNVKNKKIYSTKYDKKSKEQEIRFVSVLIIFCGIIGIYTLYQFDFENFFVDIKDIRRDDSIIMQTESIMNGKIELMENPSNDLKKMENPYDNIKRDNEGIDYLYDVAYYKGYYYNYFGIAPIITLILPFRIITGTYTHTYIFNLVFMFIAIFSLYSLYKKIINKYIKNISLCNYYLGFYAIVFGSNILTLLRGQKYDIVVTSGIAFLLISLNLAMSIYEKKKYKILKLIVLGGTTALIVLSKPNLIIYYLLILFFILVSMNKLDCKQKKKDFIIILIPLGLLAVFQMFLNYIRFENIFEFGAKYQLTGFNMEYCMSFSVGKIYAGIMEYIFKLPIINPLKFPFVFINTDTAAMSVNEILYENRVIGLAGLPIMYVYMIKHKILKMFKNKELTLFINLCIFTAISSIILNTCFGGICEVYSIDFKLILAIGAILLLLKLVEYRDDEISNSIFLCLTIATILIMIPISFTTESNLLINFASDTTVFLKNLFEFWS